MQIAGGALAGALIGGGIYLAKAAITGEGSARGFAAAAAGGAVAGALAAATGGASLAAQGTVTAAAGAAQVTTGAALAGVAGGMTQRAIETGSLAAATDPRAMAWDAAAGVAGAGAAKVAATVIRKAAPVVKAGIAKAAREIQSQVRFGSGGMGPNLRGPPIADGGIVRIPKSLGAAARDIPVRGGGRLASDITGVETIAEGRGIREVGRLVDDYGGRAASWRKMKGIAEVELPTGGIGMAEVHWYQAHGIGKVEFKVKAWLD